MMAEVQQWCRVTLVAPGGSELERFVLGGPGPPDFGAVDGVARLTLLAGRLGGGIVLAEVSPALKVLLHLAGLRLQMEGEAELGEKPLGIQEVQEVVHLGNPPA